MGEGATKGPRRFRVAPARSNTRSLLTRRTARTPAARNRYALLWGGQTETRHETSRFRSITTRPREEPAIFPSRTRSDAIKRAHTHGESTAKKKQPGRQTALVKKEAQPS